MHDRRSLLKRALALGAVAAPPAWAAPALAPGRRRLGVLLFDRAEAWDDLPPRLQKALADLGWVEGSNLDVQWYYANGEAARLKRLAAQLATSGVDAILTRGTPATAALRQATSTVPILTGLGDPVGSGFAATFARPGGNVTGVSYAVVETSLKQIELLRTMVPRLALLAILLPADRTPFAAQLFRPIEAAARDSGLATRTALVGDAAELQAALRSGRARGEFAAFVFGFGSHIAPQVIADAARALEVPAMFERREYVDAGGLASYRLYWDDQEQRTAAQIDKVFRGEKPAQIPFELPTRSEFVINKATAKSLGLALPQALFLRADAIVG